MTDAPPQGTVDPASLCVQNLNKALSKEALYLEFKKYGPLKKISFYQKNNSAFITYENEVHAKEAKRNLNHTKLYQQEISISTCFDKESMQKKKNFNLFIKNVPPKLETKTLHNFLVSTFGEIVSLLLKKNETGDQNLGYGYVQFEKEEDFQKILKYQAEQGKIIIEKLGLEFNVESFNDKNKTKSNKIHITGLYEDEVKADQKDDKLQQIKEVFEEVKKNISDSYQFKHHSEYNEDKLNFWTQIEFVYSNENDEDTIFKVVKDTVLSKFPYTSSSGQPTIKFKGKESSERKLILLGLKKTVNEEKLNEWLEKNLNIKVPKHNISIKSKLPAPIQPNQTPGQVQSEPTYTATLFLDSKLEGQQILIFISKAQNLEIVHEIFEQRHKATIFLQKSELEDIIKKGSNMKNYYNGKNFNDTNIQHEVHVINPQPSLFNNHMNQIPLNFPQNQGQFFQINNHYNPGNAPIPKQAPQYIPPPIATLPPQPPTEAPHIPQKEQQSTNIFIQFQKLNPEEKRKQVEYISQQIIPHKEQFELIDVAGKRAMLGQIIYYKIQNLDASNPNIVQILKVTQDQAEKKITEFHQEVAKITGMLIDDEIFNIEEIIEIVLNKNELIERCLEAIELIQSKSQN